ncbi:MAG: DNA-binding protein [Candidatus Schekmanbacteria bacterium RBG_16_38_10]|uniref:DNA-binding protein n=1 Tax=Candidatus Schekmanbacteria bacterium RBG_16_38_10 TaxID=1817879 RepID=A0A1F7RSN4_9BACT|nr:MAG: DNA-binding protein [Candidatus Schekmanbacteria bacterium RBG_16_38_10]
MAKEPEEWLRQADYDMDTAKCMFNAKRYFYAVFMCHLSIEKALKGLYQKRLEEIPTKTHNLVYLLNKIGIKPEESVGKFIIKLNEVSIVTRYPEELSKLQKDFTKQVVKDIFSRSMEILKWIKKQF